MMTCAWVEAAAGVAAAWAAGRVADPMAACTACSINRPA